MTKAAKRPLYTQTIDESLDRCIPPTGVIREYMEWAHKTTHTPPIFHLASILPAFAFEMSRQGYTLQSDVNERVKRKLHLWTAIVGSSSVGKSTATKTARNFYNDFRKKRFGPQSQSPYLHVEGSIQGVLHALMEDDFFDVETEQTAGILYLDEFARVLWQESGATALCLLFDGETFDRHLRSSQKEDHAKTIRNPTISACFAGTMSSLENHVSQEHVEGGLFARILWFTGSVSAEKLMFAENACEDERNAVLKSWENWNRGLMAHMALGRKKEVFLDANGLDLIEELLFDPFRELFAKDDRMNSIRMRLLNHCRTVAGLYALSRGDFEVSHDDMLRAINLAHTCCETAYGLTRGLGVNEFVGIREKLIAYIEKAGPKGRTLSELLVNGPKGLRNKPALMEQLDYVLAAEQVHPVAEMRKPGAGRPTLVRYVTAEFYQQAVSDREVKH